MVVIVVGSNPTWCSCGSERRLAELSEERGCMCTWTAVAVLFYKRFKFQGEKCARLETIHVLEVTNKNSSCLVWAASKPLASPKIRGSYLVPLIGIRAAVVTCSLHEAGTRVRSLPYSSGLHR